MANSQKGKPVELATYLKWDNTLTSNFRIKEHYDHKLRKAYVTHIYCRVCAENAHAIKVHPSAQGRAKEDMLSYVHGTSYISKFNLTRHIEGILHFYNATKFQLI